MNKKRLIRLTALAAALVKTLVLVTLSIPKAATPTTIPTLAQLAAEMQAQPPLTILSDELSIQSGAPALQNITLEEAPNDTQTTAGSKSTHRSAPR